MQSETESPIHHTGGTAAARGKTSKGKRGPAGSADEALMSKMGETIQVRPDLDP